MWTADGGIILRHADPMNRVRWDEVNQHKNTLHLRKSNNTKSIRLYPVRPADLHAACERESGYVTNTNRIETLVP
jgi:hypothetical protein